MNKLKLIALFFIATRTGVSWASGPIVYKCGSSYSQTPCEGAVSVPVDDARTPVQKSQADAEVAQQRLKGNAMEKARLQEEARALAGNTPPRPTSRKSAAKTPSAEATAAPEVLAAPAHSKNHKKKKKPEPALFTAKEAQDLARKPGAKPQ